jgi:L,D-transpeptidase ErfK/SrfK
MRSRRMLRALLAAIVAIALVLAFASAAFAGGLGVHSPVTVTVRGNAYAIPAAHLLTASSVDTPTVAAWVWQIARATNVTAANATRKLNSSKHKFVFKAARNGYTLDQAVSVDLVAAELNAEIGGASARTTALPASVTRPHVTKFGKGIIVVLSQRRIYLWDNTKVVKTYTCAIGKAQYPTPTGTFYIGRKVKNPSWTNPGSAWGKGMPAYIAPGPNNPLGTRALYVYSKSGDTGVRFHGTNKLSSVGRASSHGCMRMVRKNVEDFYNRVPVDTTVCILK